MIKVRVQSLGIDQANQSPVVLLQEVGGERVLPIWIGPAEASAIAMEMAGMKFPRPLTHDLFAPLIRGLGAALDRVVISRVEDNTYYAEMVLQRAGEVFTVDARPSDSIAIAIRMHADLFATDDLLSATVKSSAGEPQPPQPDEDSAAPGGAKMTPEQLQEYLRALKPEDLGRFNP